MVSTQTYDFLKGWMAQNLEAAYHQEFPRCKPLKSVTSYYRGSEWGRTAIGAAVFHLVCSGKERYFLCDAAQNLYAYNGMYYELIDTKPDKFLKELIRRALVEYGVAYAFLDSKVLQTFANNCLDALTVSDEYLYVAERRYVAFKNGIFDLEKGKLRPFQPEYRPYIVLDIDYRDARQFYIDCDAVYGVSSNPCKLWDTKIAEIIPNKQMRDAFQLFCGSLLVDRQKVRIEYVCYLIGTGSNGKSVLADAISGVFGEKYFSRFTPKQLFKDSDARINIAALEGKVANLVGDLDEKDMGGGDFKRFASGEKFQGRRNYKDPILVQAPPLLCCTNTMPETEDDTWGHHRRQLPIHTTDRQWTEEDKDPMLSMKLTVADARTYIFSWIYEGYKKIMRNNGNIELGEDVVEAQKRLQADSNSMRRWWSDSPYERPEKPSLGEWMSVQDLTAEYLQYCERTAQKPVDGRELKPMLKSLGYVDKRKTPGWGFYVLRKKAEEE